MVRVRADELGIDSVILKAINKIKEITKGVLNRMAIENHTIACILAYFNPYFGATFYMLSVKH